MDEECGMRSGISALTLVAITIAVVGIAVVGVVESAAGAAVAPVPGPIAGAGLPMLVIGFGAYWLVKRFRRKPDWHFQTFLRMGVASIGGHLRLPQTLDRSVRWLFVTPNMHSLHHSSDRLETDSNYGTTFTIWDRLFGTYRQAPLAGYEAFQIGLKEIRDERAWNLWWQIKSPALRI
jgi:hypothetical protein